MNRRRANQIATKTLKGQYKVYERGLREVVTDKGYHSAWGLVKLVAAGVRSYIPEKKQQRNWALGASACCSGGVSFWSGPSHINTGQVGCGGCMYVA